MERRVETPWSREPAALADELGVAIERGLAPADAAARLEVVGRNELRARERTPVLRIAVNQLESIVVWLLIAATVLSLALGDTLEGIAIGAAVLLTVALGFITELRAVRSMEALRELGASETRVRRGGEVVLLAATELVPGDVVVFEGGDRVSADLRIVSGSRLQADESVLTGESVPVSKDASTVGATAALADRRNMLWRGTNVARGAGAGIVVATGMATELGHIAALVDEHEESTPLEKQLASLGRSLLWVCVAIAAITAVSGSLSGRGAMLMIKTAIAMAVAAIPEGLPIVATVALARGLWRLASRHALIKRLSAVETLGATDVLLVDKTGTLTHNQLSVVTELPAAALDAAVLCNNASLGADGGDDSGDPLEVALLRAAADAGVDIAATAARWPRLREEAFDPAVKMMATVHADGEGARVLVKGAPEAVLAVSRATASEADALLAESERLAADGLRVLAVAEKQAPNASGEVYADLDVIGLIGFADPPREDVAAPLAACRRAGIRVIMATGDQPATAASIARAVGLADDPVVVRGDRPGDIELPDDVDVFARVAPDQKLSLVERYQERGAVVAMTGDGVNDAPALRRAQIGVAMGRRGTDVAREAADMVLVDDSFESIVLAIEQGRAIFENIRRFVVYLLSCNLAEVIIVAGAVLVGAPLPLLPLQILFLNLVTDVLPALALGFGEGSPHGMDRPPRDAAERIVGRRQWTAIALYAAVIAGSTLGAMAVARHLGATTLEATSVSFLTLGFAQLWHVFNMRDPASAPWSSDVVRSPWVWAALVACVGLLATASSTPLATVLQVDALPAVLWAVIGVASLVPLVVGQVGLWVVRRRG